MRSEKPPSLRACPLYEIKIYEARDPTERTLKSHRD